jgi:two-component system NarL family sensor kinase
MHLEPAADRDPFGPGDRRLLEDVGAQVGALVQAVALTRELQQARRRLVSAQEEERRRLRRDLHDGLGPSLATLVMSLETAQDVVREDPAKAAALVERLAERARADIDEVRRLVDGLRPAALDQLGLVSALRDRAVAPGLRSNGFGWTVSAEPDVEPLPAAVEVAAYRIAMEAVTNAARHSSATRCEVHLRRADGELELTVQDDGHGLATDAGIGVGMGSMRERAQELGGTCIVTSGTGGTLVRARLPVDEEQP